MSFSQATTWPVERIVMREARRRQGMRLGGLISTAAESGIWPQRSLGPVMTAQPRLRIQWSYQGSISARFSRHLVKVGTRIGVDFAPRKSRNFRMLLISWGS